MRSVTDMYGYTCEMCSTAYESWMKISRFCSRDCRDASMRTIAPTTCATCSAPVRKKKYCSPQCYWDSLKGKESQRKNRITLPCEVCDKPTEMKAYRRADFKYCSRDCYLTVHSADNVTSELDLLRGSARYREWRTAVFERDDYTCQECGERGGALQADHIKPFAFYPELRFDLDNGRTLCVPCHRRTDTYGVGAFKHRIAVDATGY